MYINHTHQQVTEGNLVFDVDYEDPKFQVGSKFNSADDFRLCVRQHSIIKNFNLRWANSNKKCVVVKCANKVCKWFMRASRIIDGQAFELKTLNPNHSCCGVNKSGNNSASVSG